MRYDGVDIRGIHRAIKKGREYLPTKRRALEMVETTTGTMLAHVQSEGSEMPLDVNITAVNRMEAEEAYLALSAWARGRGSVHALEPTYLPGKAYDAVLEVIERPDDMEKSHGVCRVVWRLLSPHPYSVVESSAKTVAATTLPMWVGGTAETEMVIEIVPAETHETDEGMTLELDDVPFFGYKGGRLPAGYRLQIEMRTGAVTLNGHDFQARTNYLITNFDQKLTPGQHELTCSFAADITVRWHERWA